MGPTDFPQFFPELTWLYDLVDELPGAHAADQPVWNDSVVFWIGTKMFGHLNRHSDGRMLLTLKLPPDHGLALRGEHPWITAGYHFNKRHWNSLDLEHPDASRDLIEVTVEDSHACLLASLPRWRQEEVRTNLRAVNGLT